MVLEVAEPFKKSYIEVAEWLKKNQTSEMPGSLPTHQKPPQIGNFF